MGNGNACMACMKGVLEASAEVVRERHRVRVKVRDPSPVRNHRAYRVIAQRSKVAPTRAFSDNFRLAFIPFPFITVPYRTPSPFYPLAPCIISLSRSTMSAYPFFSRSTLTGNSLRLPPSPLRSHSWAHVIIGMWHKYPNPHCSHVVTVDVIDRTVDPSTGMIRTERVLGCKQRTPTWIVRVRPPSHILGFYPHRAHAIHIAIRWFRGCVRS